MLACAHAHHACTQKQNTRRKCTDGLARQSRKPACHDLPRFRNLRPPAHNAPSHPHLSSTEPRSPPHRHHLLHSHRTLGPFRAAQIIDRFAPPPHARHPPLQRTYPVPICYGVRNFPASAREQNKTFREQGQRAGAWEAREPPVSSTMHGVAGADVPTY